MSKKNSLDCHRSGAASVEFAIVAPIMVFLFAVSADFARVYYYQQTLTMVAKHGALYATDTSVSQDSPFESVADAALASAGWLKGSCNVTVESSVDARGNKLVDVIAQCSFNPVLALPGMDPRDLSRRVRMRVLRPEPEDE